MKVIKFILCTILYILYVLVTLNARSRYIASVNRGYQCINLSGNGFIDTYTYDRSRKPERDYVTWKEFRINLRF